MTKKLIDRLKHYHPRYKFVLSLALNSRVLDLGCGDFTAMRKFIKMRPDLGFASVDIKDLTGFAPEEVEFEKVDIQNEPLPFKDNHFDAIYCSHVLEHLYTTHLVSKEIKRILRDGGKLYVETPGIRSLWVPSFRYGREQNIPFNFYDDHTHQKPFSKTGLFSFVADIGFRKIKIGTARNPWSLIISPFFFFYGLIFRNRRLLSLALWDVVGWCIYASGSNLKKD